MALIVGGTTVTGTQTLDATKLTGNLPALNGSSLTSLSAGNISSGTLDAARVPTLDGSKISGGTFGSVNGSNLTSIPSPSSIVYAHDAVGSFSLMRHDNNGTFTPNSNYSNLKSSGTTHNMSNSYSLSGTYKSFSYVTEQFKCGMGHRIS